MAVLGEVVFLSTEMQTSVFPSYFDVRNSLSMCSTLPIGDDPTSYNFYVAEGIICSDIV